MFLIVSLVPFFVLIGLFLFVPFFFMMYGSFQGNGETGWTLDQYKVVMSNVFYHQSFKNSMIISFFSSILAILLAVVTTYSFTRFSGKIQERMLVLINLTSNFSGIPLAFSFIVLLGNSGIFTLLFQTYEWNPFASFHLYSWSGLMLIYIYFQIPLAIMLLYPVYAGIQTQWKEAANLLGASTIQFWIRIGLPFMLPSIAGTFSILFANAMGAYASAYALTGSNYNLITIQIGSLLSGDIFAQPELASALAVVLGFILVVAMAINEWMTRKVRRDLS